MKCTFFASINIFSFLAGLFISSVQAEGPDNATFATGKDDIHIVKSSGPVEITITPDIKLDITNPKANALLAMVSVSSAVQGRETQFALRFSPNADNPTEEPDAGYIVDESNKNKIDVKLAPLAVHTTQTDPQGDKWLVSSIHLVGLDKTKFTAYLLTATAQPLSAGNYSANIDAAEWNE